MKYFFLFSFSILYLNCFADNPITGNQNVEPGSTETYTVNWDNWSSVYENYANVTWTVTDGTIIESDKHTVTIQWDVTPTWLNVVGFIHVEEDLGGGSSDYEVTIVNFIEGTSESCLGILGPPDIFIDFGSGNNPGPPLPNGTTTYTYNSNCAISSGEYTRTNSSVGCRSQWHGIPQDHTPGDVNGYFLMIDGDDRRGEIFRTPVTGLSSSFRYEFSAWVGNLTDVGQDPRFKFEVYDISGNVLLGTSGTLTTTYYSTFQWERISFMFDLPLGTTGVQIVLVNSNNREIGNDIVVDDISFAPCYTPILASFSPNPTVLSKSYTCDNGSVTLYSWWPTPTIPFNNPSFKWQKSSNNGSTWTDIPGATGMSYTQTENTPNEYWYRIIAYETGNPSQFVTSNSIIYYVQKMVVDPKTYFVNGCTTTPTELNSSSYLQYSDPSVSLSFTYNWTPSTYLNNSTISNPTITLPALPPNNPPNPPSPPPPVNYSYNLTVQNSNYGCIASNTQTVSHLNPRTVYLYNAFTPNNDGSNDYFRPVNIQDYNHFGAEFSIFNRWGQLIFYRNSGATLLDWSWDGKIGGVPQPSGNFVYTLKIPGCPTNYQACPGCNVNAPNSSNNYTISGNFVLIR